jgi:uncharacterized protein DUF1592/uncharacterized protein DUF1588/uncharacterized protein DUF1595/uncharacterized protein DUF1585
MQRRVWAMQRRDEQAADENIPAKRPTDQGSMLMRHVLTISLVGVILCAGGPWSAAKAETNFIRLTPEQYQRSIHDIFGASIRVDDNKAEPGFRTEGLLALGNRKLTVGSSELASYEAGARGLADQVVDPRHRAVLMGCTPKSEDAPDDACARQFIARLGLLLFRRPLSPTEVQTYVGTQNTEARQLRNFYSGLAAAITQMVIAPDFLFRVESSEPDPARPGSVQLDAYSRASRLSYFLWNSTPDIELLAAAESGRLMSTAGLKQQVERLLASPRAEDGMRAFFVDMLGFGGLDQDPGFDTLSIDTSLYPNFTPNVLADAQEQTLRTIVDHLLHKNKDYRDLFVTRDTFVTPALAALYRVPISRSSQELGGAIPWIPYHYADSDPYVGLFSQVSFLSLHSHPGRTSPTRRGKALREIFFCQNVPPPPGNVDFGLVQNTSDPRYKTVRQRLTAHRTESTCAGCHKIMDPIGLSFENFDTAGEYRATENGAPIDASGELNGKGFEGPKQLTQIVRDDPAVTACLLKRAYSYGTERKPNTQEQAWLANLQSELSKNGVKWRDLMLRITLNPDFYTIPMNAVSLSASTSR